MPSKKKTRKTQNALLLLLRIAHSASVSVSVSAFLHLNKFLSGVASYQSGGTWRHLEARLGFGL